jgi:hypothetical protein
MPYRSDDGENTAATEEVTAPDESAHLLTLFNYYWLKFLSRKRTIDQTRKLVEDRLMTLENEEKIRSMRDTIHDISSSS